MSRGETYYNISNNSTTIPNGRVEGWNIVDAHIIPPFHYSSTEIIKASRTIILIAFVSVLHLFTFSSLAQNSNAIKKTVTVQKYKTHAELLQAKGENPQTVVIAQKKSYTMPVPQQAPPDTGKPIKMNGPSTCDNLDFARGDFTGWVGKTSVYPNNWPDCSNCSPANNVAVSCTNGSGVSCNGCYSGNGLPVPPPFAYALYYLNTGIVPGRHTIMSTSTPDPYACDNINTLPPGEPFCARLGNGGIGAWGNGVEYQVDYLSYSFVVSNANSLLTYKYAIILQDPLRDPNNPKHTPSIRPRFNVYIRDQFDSLIDPTCGKFEVIYDTTLVGFRECKLAAIQGFGGNPLASVGTAYRAWTTVGVDLRKYINTPVTLTFNTWDCGWGGHFGYAYVSARCDSFVLTTQSCDGTVLVTAPEGFSYKWFPGGETTRSIKVYNAQPGDSAYVELTTENGCKTSLSTKVYPVLAKANYNVNPTVVCLKDPISFADTSVSINTYDGSKIPIVKWEWRFGDNKKDSVAAMQHIYTTPGTYTVNLTITNAIGCKDSIQKIVQVLPLPIANFATNDVCKDAKANFTDLSIVTGVTQFLTDWDWTFIGQGSSDTLQNTSHTYNTAGTFDVKLAIETNTGCKDDTIMSIKIWPPPVANFSAANVCLGDTTEFLNKSTKGDPADNIVNWIWNFGDSSSLSSDVNPDHIYSNDTSFKVHLIVGSNKGCVNDTIISVLVNPNPIANFSATPTCAGSPISFTDMSTPVNTIASWSWNFNDITNNTSNAQNPTHTYDSSMLYNPSLTVTTLYGCVDSIIIPFDVLPLPEVRFDADKYSGCSTLCVNFIDLSFSSSDSIVKWDWTFGDNNGSTLKLPPHCYPDPGVYDVSLSVETARSCKASWSWPKMIEVYPHPTADFIASPTETMETDPTIQFTDRSSGATQWRWTFGDYEGATGVKDTSHTYKASGTYDVWLYVANQYNCVDSIDKEIIIRPEWTFYVPNAFTPNNNGLNDGFIAYATNVTDFEMWVFDRWGNLIYHCNDPNKPCGPWNGIVTNGISSGRPAQQDVYVWKINLKDIFNKKHHYIGHVTLVK